MSFDSVTGFSWVYGFQQTYRAQVLQLTQAQMMGLLHLSKVEEEGEAALGEEINRRSMPVVELLIGNEQQLIEAYDRALAYRD